MKNALFLLILVADIAESAVIRLPLRVVPTTSNLVPRGLKNGQPSKKNANVEAGETGFDWNSLFSSRISPASTGVFGYESLQLSIGLGTPPQNFNVTIEYITPTLAVFAQAYNETHCKGKTASRHTFAKTRSSTFTTTNSGRFGIELPAPYADVTDCGNLNATGWSEGVSSYDTLTIDSQSVPKVQFDLMDTAQPFNPQWASDGVFGLAIYGSFWGRTIIPFLKGLGGEPYVSVYLPPVSNPDSWSSSGVITFGALETEKCSSQWTWVPKGVPFAGYWNLNVTTFSLGPVKGLDTVPAILRVMSAYTWAPSKTFAAIMAQLGAEYSFKYDDYTVKCAKVSGLPDMIFTLKGWTQTVTPKLYTRPIPADPKTCAILLRDIVEVIPKGEDAWVLGTSFLRSSCHALDTQFARVGFATSKRS